MAKWKKYQGVAKPRIKKGDTVVVISGNQKGEQGEAGSSALDCEHAATWWGLGQGDDCAGAGGG